MQTLDTWILPFTFIPGVAMLVLSTANRFHFVNVLIRELVAEHDQPCGKTLAVLLKRSRHFQRALVSFYLSICLFACSALFGSIASKWFQSSLINTNYMIDIAVMLGVAALIYGAMRLVKESLLAFHMASSHCQLATSPQPEQSEGDT